ncbi:MAG: carotenoid oxygenase family protein [Acidimicrobiia bacterium]
MTAIAPNPYLLGNYAPVHDERDDADLEVTGAVPPELHGLLLRNGPNPIVDPDPAMYHWFLGDSMLHGIELRGGRARYRNRFVRTPSAAAALGEDAPGKSSDVNGVEGKASTALVHHAGRILALYEVSLPTEVRSDLSTVGALDFDGALGTPFTAHPKVDPITGEMVFFGYDVFGPPYLRYHVVDASGHLVTAEAITLPAAVMMHDFAITSTRAVFMDLPVVFDLALVGTQPAPFAWRPDNGARVGVMPRSGTDADVVWCDVEPCYVYHPMNAYDDADGNVVLDVARYPDMFETQDNGPGASTAPRLERWLVDQGRARVTVEMLDDSGQELPRIDERQTGRVHRYGYTMEITSEWAVQNGLRKHDLVAGKVERHDAGTGRAAGEPVFVPASPDAGEDEGWVLSVVYDATTDSSDVLVIDATDFTAAPVATIHLRRRVPFGFHGIWVAGARLE